MSGGSSLRSRLMQRLHRPVYEARLRELVGRITPHLHAGDRVLDVGCGFGELARRIQSGPQCPPDVEVRGLERFVRDEQLIPIDAYEGGVMPYQDNAFDVVILADVLHHEEDPHKLIRESARVAGRLLIIKDHKIDGLLARPRVCLIDWAANAPYGVRCLFRYNTLAEWRQWHDRHGFDIAEERTSLNVYPPVVNLLAGRRLHYFAVLST